MAQGSGHWTFALGPLAGLEAGLKAKFSLPAQIAEVLGAVWVLSDPSMTLGGQKEGFRIQPQLLTAGWGHLPLEDPVMFLAV